ncbi:MFS transporter [Pyruvatibacter mobilis]|uniref:MFS transporter n=1 Tax=Pyruvatibacter mobilis TaxID=1712261 RepID=UPI003BAADCFF
MESRIAPDTTGASGQSDQPRLGNWTKTAFALPAAPIAAMGLPIVVYLPPFYANEMGLGLALVGYIFMITRFWDVFTDPVLGVLSDKYKTRWGRRRHWIVLSVPIMLVSVWMVFMPEAPVSGGYLLIWMVILYIGWTLLTLSHMSWGAELTPDYNERSSVQAFREMALIGGMILVLLMPVFIEAMEPENLGAARVASMGWFVLILLPITVAIAVWVVPERRVPDPVHVRWQEAVRVLVANAPLRRVLVADLISGVSGGIVTGLFLFLAADVLDLKNASLLILVYLTSGCLFVPIIVRLSYKWGKHRTLAYSSLFSAVTVPLIFLVSPGDLLFAVFIWICLGVNMGAGPFLFRSIMADVADHDEVQGHNQRTGLFYSLLTLTNKVGAALAVGITYPALELVGFVPGAENASAAEMGLRMIYVLPPMAIGFIVAWVMWNFPIDEEIQSENRRILSQRAAAAEGAGGNAGASIAPLGGSD